VRGREHAETKEVGEPATQTVSSSDEGPCYLRRISLGKDPKRRQLGHLEGKGESGGPRPVIQKKKKISGKLALNLRKKCFGTTAQGPSWRPEGTVGTNVPQEGGGGIGTKVDGLLRPA